MAGRSIHSVRTAIPAPIRPGVRTLVEKAAGLALRAFRSRGRRGVPLRLAVGARRIFPIANAFDAPSPTTADGAMPRNRGLAHLLSGADFGGWAIDADAVDVLEELIAARRPDAAIEFGSGVSTACLAYFLRGAHGDEEPRLVSIEQDEHFAERTRALLAATGLLHLVRLETRPLARAVVDGAPTTTYDLPREFLQELLGAAAPSFVLVDGPSGGAGRYATLRLVQPYLAHEATIVLDDALRDAELEVAVRWHRARATTDERIVALRKGLLIAHSPER